MKRFAALILAFLALYLFCERPWEPEVPATSYNSGYTYTGNYGYSYDYGYDYNSRDDDYFTMKCTWCHGSGVCDDCNGSGRSKLKGVLGANGCTLCDASGECYKCKGRGYTIHY